MSLVKSGNIANCCAPNALMTLKEYMEDYASPAVRRRGKDDTPRDHEDTESPRERGGEREPALYLRRET